MGLRDAKYTFASLASIDASLATNDSTNVIDFGSASAGPEMGEGEPLYWNVKVGEAYAASASDATIQFTLCTSDDNSSWATLLSTNVMEVEAETVLLGAGGEPVKGVSLPAGRMERYAKMEIISAGATVSAGTYSGWLSIK
jgi:hypothetical protein